MGDWDNPYKTMDSGFEIRQLEVFKKMFDKGEMSARSTQVRLRPAVKIEDMD
jgi:isoleucyl-tRNA synthetase